MLAYLIIFIGATVVSAIITFLLLYCFQIFKVGQSIRQEGPASHLKKTGTPTLGGIAIIVAVLIFSCIFLDLDLNPNLLAVLLLSLGFALLGFIDDILKILRKSDLGLSFLEKILSQTIVAIIFCSFLMLLDSNLGIYWLLYFPFITFIIVGCANATNLTDGLDGLLAGCAIIAFSTFGILALFLKAPQSALFAFIFAGAILGFLKFNFPKASIFMGDTGSLAIGAGLAGLAIILGKELLLAFIGGIYALEALSVIAQVTSFKYFKKRIFKMTPLHHHFELIGWPEKQIVISFWVVQVILGLLGIWLGIKLK